jgi:hypothetical protein
MQSSLLQRSQLNGGLLHRRTPAAPRLRLAPPKAMLQTSHPAIVISKAEEIMEAVKAHTSSSSPKQDLVVMFTATW